MHELVTEHVVAVGDGARKRKDDPPLEGFGHTAGPLAQVTLDRVRLPEMRAACVEDERLPRAELMIQQLRKARIPALGHPRRQLRGLFLFRVVVDVEVVRLQYFEVEFAVLNLVPAEVAPLGDGNRGQPEQETQGCRDEGEVTFHIVPAEATDMPTASRIFLEETFGWGGI